MPYHGLNFSFFLLWLTAGVARAAQPVRYVVDLGAPETHLLQVAMNIPDASAGAEIQIPAWNCLYQFRDFVKNVEDLKGQCDGQPAPLDREDLDTWRGPRHACRNLAIHYAVYANTDGPFDSVLDRDHSFLNLAMVLFYLPRERQRPVQIRFQLPDGWKLATLLDGDGNEFQAANYDALVDSPVDAGHFEEYTYTQALVAEGAPDARPQRARIRLIIDANRDDYSPGRILDSIHKITAEETTLMHDLPFDRYTFILQFPRNGGASGGMEHLNGAAISLPAFQVRTNEGYLESLAAHEFFHAWNVKRIRPQSLEPVDYIKGNDTRDLWFCEGVTNTYAQLVLLRANLIDRDTFYERVAFAVQTLQSHDARRFQSAAMSGREAWLEKYSDYNHPERSVSYYNKGEVLGYLLDLGIRHASHNQAGLDDVMRRLNNDFARRGRFYTTADLIAVVADLAPAFDMSRFLADYVSGTSELDYSTYLGYAGLSLATRQTELPARGFSASRNAGGLLQVDFVDPGSDAERAGLQAGDLLTVVDGHPLPAGGNSSLTPGRPGQTMELQIARDGRTHTLKFRIGSNQEIAMRITDVPAATPDELRVREGWLKGTTTGSLGLR